MSSPQDSKGQKLRDRLVNDIWWEVKLAFVVPFECPGCSPDKFTKFVEALYKVVDKNLAQEKRKRRKKCTRTRTSRKGQ